MESAAQAALTAVYEADSDSAHDLLSRAQTALRGVAELDPELAEAATLLNEQGARWPDAFRRSLGVVLKDEDDLVHIAPKIDAILAEAQA